MENGLPALIAFANSVGIIPSKNAAAKTAPCTPAEIFRDTKNEAAKYRKYPDARNKFGSLKFTDKPMTRPTNPAKASRCRCAAEKKRAVSSPPSAQATMVGATE